MNPEKLKKLQAQAAEVRIGGKGEMSVKFAKTIRDFVVFYFAHTMLNKSSRHAATQEESHPPEHRHWRQEVAAVAEEARHEQYSRHWGGQHVQERWVSRKAAQSWPGRVNKSRSLSFMYWLWLSLLFFRTVIHFNHPRTQASLAANTFAISGHGESKSVSLISLLHFPLIWAHMTKVI